MTTPDLILSIDPITNGFAYAVLEGSFLVDWGTMRFSKKKNTRPAHKPFDFLVLRYLPTLIVLERPQGSRRGRVASNLIETLTKRALSEDIPVELVSRKEVQEVFQMTGQTKQDIAEEIALRFPGLKKKLPPRRRAWESEVERMSIFDAVSFALTALTRMKQGRSVDLRSIDF